MHEFLSHSDNNELDFNSPVDYGVDGDFQDDPADAEIEFAKISAAFGSDTAKAAPLYLNARLRRLHMMPLFGARQRSSWWKLGEKG